MPLLTVFLEPLGLRKRRGSLFAVHRVQQVYLFFPFPYAINAMREAIARLYQNQYLIYILQLMLFFVIGLLIGIFAKRSLGGINKYMNEQLDKTEMM